MQINSIYTYSILNHDKYMKQPAMKSWRKDVFQDSELAYKTSTFFYRGDFACPRLVEFLENKYKNIPKVNIYDYACSNGSEAFTLVMELLNHVQDNAKFFPIIAKDIDKEAIDYAKYGPIPIMLDEERVIKERTNNKFYDYFKPIKHDYCFNNDEKGKEQSHYEPKDFFKNYIKFSTANILDDYKTIEPDNSVVLVRNFWSYLSVLEQHTLAGNLYNHLGKNSLIMIGNFDTSECSVDNRSTEIDRVLEYFGFKETSFHHVYEKV